MFIGVTYNWKGLKEENYLYTLQEMEKFDAELLQACKNNPEQWHSWTGGCACKTAEARLLTSSSEVISFLNGDTNDSVEDMIQRNFDDDEEYDGCYDDWYWVNVLDNDFFGEYSETMKSAVKTYQIDEALCQ